MTSTVPAAFNQTSTTTKHDSMELFKHFIDIITPPEFAKLLRARVKHLLKTWPPQSASTVSATSSPYLTPSNAYSPSFESVRGFAAFFRTQDSPGPSPIDLSATTSLQALHHHLLALQTLLSFLSARELQDIVRARLSESGQDRSAAVQGLMDVMRDPGSNDMLEQLVGKGDPSLMGGIKRSDNDGRGQEGVDQPLMSTGEVPPSDINMGRRKVFFNGHEGMDAEAEGEAMPPKKRQRSEHERGDRLEDVFPNQSQPDSQNPSNSLADESAQSTLPPVSTFLPSNASASPSTLVTRPIITENCDSTVIQSGLKLEEELHSENHMVAGPISKSHSGSVSPPNCASRREKLVVENHDDIKADASDLESRSSTNILHASDVEDEGLVVTLIEEDIAQRGPQTVASSPNRSLPTTQGEPVSSDSAPVPVAVSIAPTSNPTSGEEKPTPFPFDADLEVGPGPGVSRAEWNRKRFRAALGLPPKEPENVRDTMDATVTVNTASVQEEIHPKIDYTSPRLVPQMSEVLNEMIGNPAIAFTQDASLASARPHTPATTLHAGFPISRSPTPSIRGSSCDSPPGPILRAVDWDSHPVQEGPDSDMEIDELDELDGSEDTLAMGNGASYNLIMNAEGGLKSSTYGGAFSYHHASMAGWSNVNGVNGSVWDHGDSKEYDMGPQGDDLTQSQGAGATDSQRKLFIRLPARGLKGDNGMMSNGTDGSGSGSGSASPSPPSPYRHAPSSGKAGVDYDQTGADRDQTLGMQQTKRQSPLGSPPPSSIHHAPGSSGSVTDTSSLPPSHGQSQASSASHTPNSAGAASQGHRLPQGVQSQSYPPPHAYGTPWFSAMFYVPFSGAPHIHQHPLPQGPGSSHPHMYSPTQMQMSPTPGSKSGAENGRSPVPGSSPDPGSMGVVMASGSNGSSPHVAPPEGPKRGFKRRAPGEPGDPISDGESDDPDVRYTDDVGVKETATLKRFCNNCTGVKAPSWRKSKLNVGKILCNKCGIYESTHMTPRPLKTRPRRSNFEGGAKKRKNSITKKLAPALSS